MKPKHVLAGGVVVLIAILAIALWHSRSGTAADTAASSPAPAGASHATTAAPLVRPDPRKLDRGSIAGTITDEAKRPIANARVCVDAGSRALPGDLTRDPRCVETDASGHYLVGNLYAARYTVVAMAKGFRPDYWWLDADRRVNDFVVAAGEHAANIDIVLRSGGVEITGTVSDVTGGTIPRARVRAGAGGWFGNSGFGPMVETDERGHYALWVKRGNVSVTAVADGYAPGNKNGSAPGKLDVLLTPESTLSGTVVDATSAQPVEGAHVEIDGWESNADDLTDEKGRFHLTRLNPGRYVTVAHAPMGYGKSDGSTLVGLGQHVDGVTIKLWPAQRLAAHVVIGADKKPCPRPDASLEDTRTQRWIGFEREPDGTLVADGVLAGTYKARPSCDGYAPADTYPKVEVTAKETAPIEWRVDPGATITGRVLTKAGAPIDDAEVTSRVVGGTREDMQWGSDRSKQDGTYKLVGLRPGKFKLEVTTDVAVSPKEGYPVDVAAGATIARDLILDDGGSIRGTVVDETGAAVADVQVDARSSRQDDWMFMSQNVRSDDTGAFHIDALRAGDYRVVASRNWSEQLKKPGTTDDARQGEKVTVAAAQTATVRVLVESQGGTIKGTVTDPDGKPVSDAFVSSARESDAAGAQQSNVQSTRWFGEERPIVTGTDGTFALTKLSSPGKYTLRAYRKGGGEAVAEHVAVGSTAVLQIKPTGSITGVVKRDGGPPPDEITIDIRDPKTGFAREESFYRTAGKYAVRDLPAGHFLVGAKAQEGHQNLELDLADGEAKAGLDFTLASLLVVTGRVVEAGTHTPVPGIMTFASLARSADFSFGMDTDQTNISDADGRFTIKNVPRGQIQIRGFPRDWNDSPYAFAAVVKQLDGTGSIDIGELPVQKKRVKPGDPIGELGIHFAEQAPDTPPEQTQYKVSFIDPAGPAAKVDLKVGDVVVAIDGQDVTGVNAAVGYNQLQAPPGTTMRLGLARGTTVAIVLATP